MTQIYLTKKRYYGQTCACGNSIRLKINGDCVRCGRRPTADSVRAKNVVIVASSYAVARLVINRMILNGKILSTKFIYANDPDIVRGWTPEALKVVFGPGYTQYPEIVSILEITFRKHGLKFEPLMEDL